MNKKVYLNLQLKRGFKLYPSILIITFILAICIAMSALAVWHVNQNSGSRQIIRVGVVGNAGDSYLGIGVYAIKNMDSSRFYIDLAEMSETEAAKALKNNEIAGYVYIPDDFIRGIETGTNVPLQYITSQKPAGFGDILEREVVMMVSDLVTESQKSVYSTVDLARAHGASQGIGKKIEKLNLSYISYVLNRNETHELVLTGIKDDLSYGGYYICAIITFFLMIWGISCSKLLSEQNYELSKLLCQRGISAFRQMYAKFLSFAVLTMLTLAIFALCFGFAANINDFGIPELLAVDVPVAVGFVIKILPVILMFAAMHIMLYEFFSGSVGSILAQFIIAVGLGYISGVFYPNTFFPESVQNFAAYLPSGAGFSYIRKSMSGASVFNDLILVTLYGAAFYFVSVLIRKYKIKGDNRI